MKKYRLSFFMLFFTLIFVQAVCAAPEYLLPDADSHYYTKDEIADMPVQLVCYAKNEIYARHGRQFVSPELQKYFGSCSWYHGTVRMILMRPISIRSSMIMRRRTCT